MNGPLDNARAIANPLPRHVELDDVGEFHAKFGVPESPAPAFLDTEAQKFRSKFMQEELDEFQDAYSEKDLNKAADALGDLVYVAIGTARKMGLPWPAIWSRIQAANMTKELALPDGSNSKRGSPMDVIKPINFVAPDHTDLLGLAPGQLPAVFDATKAVLQWGDERRAGQPMTDSGAFLMSSSTGTGAAMEGTALAIGETGSLLGDGSGSGLPPADTSAGNGAALID